MLQIVMLEGSLTRRFSLHWLRLMRLSTMQPIVGRHAIQVLMGWLVGRDAARRLPSAIIFKMMSSVVASELHWRASWPVSGDRAQILASMEHLAAPIASAIEMTMALTVRSLCPDVGAAVHEHDVGNCCS
jgi:hypothetical protein